MRRAMIAVACLVLAGCGDGRPVANGKAPARSPAVIAPAVDSGRERGARWSVGWRTPPLYLKRAAFDRSAELASLKVKAGKDDWLRTVDASVYLDEDSEFVVVRRVEGGVEVVVAKGAEKTVGMKGWILDDVLNWGSHRVK